LLRSRYGLVLVDQASEHWCAPDPVRGERDDAKVISQGAQVQGAAGSAGVVVPDVPGEHALEVLCVPIIPSVAVSSEVAMPVTRP
jgi:hypothetical protein